MEGVRLVSRNIGPLAHGTGSGPRHYDGTISRGDARPSHGTDGGECAPGGRRTMLETLRQPDWRALAPYREGRDTWPQGSHYRFHRAGHELVRVGRGLGEP